MMPMIITMTRFRSIP